MSEERPARKPRGFKKFDALMRGLIRVDPREVKPAPKSKRRKPK
jgi:hypothetical protein